jgi:hypothetical protein
MTEADPVQSAAVPPAQKKEELSLEEKELAYRAALAQRGQVYAFASLSLILATVVTLGLTGHDWLAGAIAGTYLVSIVGLFVTGNYRKAK